jgi:hypothetical protein
MDKIITGVQNHIFVADRDSYNLGIPLTKVDNSKMLDDEDGLDTNRTNM